MERCITSESAENMIMQALIAQLCIFINSSFPRLRLRDILLNRRQQHCQSRNMWSGLLGNTVLWISNGHHIHDSTAALLTCPQPTEDQANQNLRIDGLDDLYWHFIILGEEESILFFFLDIRLTKLSQMDLYPCFYWQQ